MTDADTPLRDEVALLREATTVLTAQALSLQSVISDIVPRVEIEAEKARASRIRRMFFSAGVILSIIFGFGIYNNATNTRTAQQNVRDQRANAYQVCVMRNAQTQGQMDYVRNVVALITTLEDAEKADPSPSSPERLAAFQTFLSLVGKLQMAPIVDCSIL